LLEIGIVGLGGVFLFMTFLEEAKGDGRQDVAYDFKTLFRRQEIQVSVAFWSGSPSHRRWLQTQLHCSP